MNPKTFIKKWIEGMKNLTPVQQLHGKMVGLIGGVIGLSLAIVMLIIKRSWGFAIFIFFVIWIQVIQYIGTRQQYIQIVKTMEEIEKENKEKRENQDLKDIDINDPEDYIIGG